MTFKIDVQIDSAFGAEAAPKLIRAAARAALKHQSAPAGNLAIVITGDDVLRRLNRDFLGHDYATDVLAFPAGDDHPEQATRYFGDLAISFERAAAQAHAGGHTVMEEVQLLVAHGVLHLLGHDHARPEDKRRMWAAQGEILRRLGVSIAGPAET